MCSPTTSSPQTPPSLPLIRYFDMLPLELVQEVMHYLIPAEITNDNQGGRRKTIPTLCLTSKTFHQLARPFLADALWLGDAQLTAVPRQKREIWKNCRWLRLNISSYYYPETKAVLEELVRDAARLDEVTFCGMSSTVGLLLTSSKIRYLHYFAI